MTFEDQWDIWRSDREARIRAPYGPLALIGTHWITGETVIPDLPGRWSVDAGGVVVKAVRSDRLLVDGQVVDGAAAVRSDRDPDPSPIAHGDWRLAVIGRQRFYGVRVFDPKADTRSAFCRIDTFPPDPRWVARGRFRPYGVERTIPVASADGGRRHVLLVGTVAFDLDGATFTLQVGATANGLSATFSDQTSGRSTFKFRVVELPEPDTDGLTWVDFNRAILPPCAFSGHFLCPFPPPGNALAIPVGAGEKAVLQYRLVLERRPPYPRAARPA